MLRAILAARQGRLKGTQTAVRVSQVFAGIFGVIGFLQFNFLLILIALFVYAGAKSELMVAMARGLLRGVRAGDIGMRMNAISDDLDLDGAAMAMVRTRSLALPVRTSSHELTVVTAEQIKRIPRKRWSEVSVREVMSTMPLGADVQAPLDEVRAA